jgi:hypothetical protein
LLAWKYHYKFPFKTLKPFSKKRIIVVESNEQNELNFVLVVSCVVKLAPVLQWMVEEQWFKKENNPRKCTVQAAIKHQENRWYQRKDKSLPIQEP